MIFSLFILFILSYFLCRGPKNVLACGLFGYSGKDPVDLLRLRYLACENQSRGDHSTGVYGNHLYKKAKEARDFVLDDEFYEAVVGANTIIGHTRHATMGAKIDRNSHPFEVYLTKNHTDPAVVGTHNGMLFTSVIKELCEKNELKEPEVDSELIYQIMVKCGFNYDEALSQIDGAMALGFIRPEHPDYLYLYHRQSRPLHVGFLNGNMWYSSESRPLHFIGCTSIAALDTDDLHVFRKGGLVEVSPVKKSRITSIKEDQTLTAWANTVATYQEKAALGLSGASAVRTNAGTENQLTIDTPVMTPMRGGGFRTNYSNGGGGNSTFPTTSKSPLLLPNIDPICYSYEITQLKDPTKGRYYSSGNNNSCYFVFQLLLPNGDVKLPGWLVRMKNRKEYCSITTHNGIGLIEVPLAYCGTPMALEILTPIKQEVIYETTIDSPVAGRVLEVALRIPFRKEEEANKEGKEDLDFKSTNDLLEYAIVKYSDKVATFQQWLTRECRSFQRAKKLQGLFRISSPTSGGVFESNIPSRIDEINTDSTCGLSCDYDEKTDILNMDKYQVQINLDEITRHQAAISKALSSIDGDPNAPQTVLSSLEPFLDYLRMYLNNRLDSIEQKEVDDAENQYRITDDRF
jgi:hypothetical protein